MAIPMRIGAMALAVGLAAAPAAAKTVKVGFIAPFSGPASIYGTSWSQGIEVYMKMHGDSVDGNKVELIKRDLPGPDPLKAKALAQELVVKQGVQYLIGLVYSPNALALASFANTAHVPIIIMTAASSSILPKSDYLLRTCDTVAQISAPEAIYARNHGFKRIVSLVADYAPGWDGEKAFDDTFEKNGGTIAGKIRMPLSTTDFVPYIQRAQTMNPDALFGFLPGGGPTYEFLTAYNNSGLKASGVTYLGQGETDENDLPKYGDMVLGLITDFYYSEAHQNAENAAFKKVLNEMYPKVRATPYHADGTAAMTLLYHMIQATHGEKDGDKAMAAARGFAFEDIRGPVKIDPKTRDIIQNVYIRRVEKDPKTGELYNKEIVSYPMQPDYGRPDVTLPTVASLKPVNLE
ncbi:MAG TPA: ABC transporter substrate-binding protein [Hyphomicrobiales bacterium]|nr:ABC transporter substrate-binding protein [Hyphomicrobiales bacterium]